MQTQPKPVLHLIDFCQKWELTMFWKNQDVALENNKKYLTSKELMKMVQMQGI